MKTCVFAGTFDPITNGHKNMIDSCLNLFDKVIIGVGVNEKKKPMFSVEDRVAFINAIYGSNDRVEVLSFSGLLVDFMKMHNASIYVRGLRNEEDYKYESVMAKYNKDLFKELTTVFLPTPEGLSYVSSSGVRALIQLGSDVKGYVPEECYGLLMKLLENKADK